MKTASNTIAYNHRVELNLALSPYALTTREPSAAAALLLGTRIITMMPTPFGFTGGSAGRQQVRDAVERSPSFLRLMESWRWAAPLWQAGVIRSEADAQDVGEDVRRIWDRILTPPESNGAASPASDYFAPLRNIMRPTLYRDEREYLDLVCRDLLKGGPDPGIGIVVAAGLDAFSVRRQLTAVRTGIDDSAPCGVPSAGGAGGSVWQRAEATLCRRTFAVGIPVLTRASGQRIMAARASLAEELTELRSALASSTALSEDSIAAADRLTHAAAGYTRAFQALGPEIRAGDDDEGQRVQEGYISLTGVHMPADAALRSSLTAVRALALHSGGRPPSAQVLPVGEARLDGPPGATLSALVVRRMKIRPEQAPALSGGGSAASPRRQ